MLVAVATTSPSASVKVVSSVANLAPRRTEFPLKTAVADNFSPAAIARSNRAPCEPWIVPPASPSSSINLPSPAATTAIGGTRSAAAGKHSRPTASAYMIDSSTDSPTSYGPSLWPVSSWARFKSGSGLAYWVRRGRAHTRRRRIVLRPDLAGNRGRSNVASDTAALVNRVVDQPRRNLE